MDGPHRALINIMESVWNYTRQQTAESASTLTSTNADEDKLSFYIQQHETEVVLVVNS